MASENSSDTTTANTADAPDSGPETTPETTPETGPEATVPATRAPRKRVTKSATSKTAAKKTAAKKTAVKKTATSTVTKSAATSASRAGTKKATPAAAVDAAEVGPAGDSPETGESSETPETATQVPEAPVKRARRARKTAEPAVEPERVVETQPDEDAPVEEGKEEGKEEGEDGAESAATVPSFGLLFQAPEPVAPRRRRATSAAGAPSTPRATQEPDGPAPTQAGASGRAGASGESGTATEPGKAIEPSEPVEPQDDVDTTDRSEAGSEEQGEAGSGRRSRRRGGRGRRTRGGEGDQSPDSEESGEESPSGDAAAGDPGSDAPTSPADDTDESSSSRRRRTRRRRGGSDSDSDESRGARARDEVTALRGSTRLEAKKQRRREGREAGRRRQIITEAEFLARRESVERVMVVREREGRTQIAVLEDGVLVEHYVSRETGASMIGNVYLGRVQNVLPSMEAAFVDVGKGRNAVLYAGEVNWDAAGLEGNVPKRIENALGSGDTVLVQVTKDPIGHKGARLTSQVSLPGRFLVYVPEASMTGISRKLPDTERARLKSILKRIVPDEAGVIVRTAAEGASEEELTADIERLTKAWERIRSKAERAGKKKGSAPVLLHGEPDLTVKVIRDVFNEDFTSLVVAGEKAWEEVSEYLGDVAPELAKRLTKWTGEADLFAHHRVDEQLAKALDRKVWLPSGGSLVIDRTEAMTVVDVNTGKFVGSGGNLEETVTKNNIEAAEEIVRQLRLRDIGGIIVIDFIDMVLESNRDLVVRRLLECLGRDRTKHQVAEVTSLGLVQMTRKRVGSGLLEVFSEPCVHCAGRGVVVHSDPLDHPGGEDSGGNGGRGRGRGGRGGSGAGTTRSQSAPRPVEDRPQGNGPTAAQIAAAAHAAALKAVAAASSGAEADAGAEGAAAGEQTDLAQPQAGTDLVLSVAGAAEVAVTDPAVADTAVTHTAVADTAGTHTAEPEARDEEHRRAPEPTYAPASEPTKVQTPVTTPEPADSQELAQEPAPAARPRRRRGRAVSQAGPPGQAQVRVITSEDSSDD